MLHAYVIKDVQNQSLAVVTGELNGMMVIEPVTSKNNSGELVRVIEGLMGDIMDRRNFEGYSGGKYTIRAGEFCRVERIENESEKVG